MTLRTLRFATAVASMTFLTATAALAGMISYSTSVPLSNTDWSASATLPQFNQTLGCLRSICFNLDGHVQGDIRFESLDQSPTMVTSALGATITLTRPDNSTLVTTLPVIYNVDNLIAFDGNVDFGGGSGRIYSNLIADKADSACSISPTDFALFTGSGSVVMPVLAAGTSNASGAGNLVITFGTQAAATVTVTYNYEDCPTPAKPATWGAIKGLYR